MACFGSVCEMKSGLSHSVFYFFYFLQILVPFDRIFHDII